MIRFRHLEGREDLGGCVELQRKAWGEGFAELVPASILQVSQKVGGLLGGAFEGPRLLGFVYSLIGVQGGKIVQWSHMLAVDPEARGQGLGRRLKLFQRTELLNRGVHTVFWTFDPLVAQNAHLNVNRLGALIVGYVPNMYGESTGSALHVGGATDRFVVRWDLKSPRVRWAVDGDVAADRSGAVTDAPTIEAPEPGTVVEDAELPETDAVRIEIPYDLATAAERDAEHLARWRDTVRHAFLTYLRGGYVVQSFHRESSPRRCFYFLRRP